MDVLIWEGHGRGGGRFEWYALHSVLRIMYVRRNRAEAFCRRWGLVGDRQDLCWFSNSSLHRRGFVVASIPDLPVRVDLAACFAVFDGAFLVVGLVSLLK